MKPELEKLVAKEYPNMAPLERVIVYWYEGTNRGELAEQAATALARHEAIEAENKKLQQRQDAQAARIAELQAALLDSTSVLMDVMPYLPNQGYGWLESKVDVRVIRNRALLEGAK